MNEAEAWLNRIFGHKADGLFGTWLEQLLGTDGDPSFFADVAGIANIIGLILAVVILVYVMVASVIRTASEGVVLGKQWSTVWLPARVALGLALIMPVAGGISPAQHMIIGLVNAGDRLASIAWGTVIDNTVDGVPLVEPRVVADYGYTSKQLTSLTCAQSIWTNRGERGPVIEYETFGGRSGSVEGPVRSELFRSLPADVDLLRFGEDGACGEQEFSNSLFSRDGDAGGLLDAMTGVTLDAYAELAPLSRALLAEAGEDVGAELRGVGGRNGLLATADSSGVGGTPELDAVAERLTEIDLAQQRALSRRVQEVMAENNDQLGDELREALGENGWASGGAYFYQLDRYAQRGQRAVEGLRGALTSSTSRGLCDRIVTPGRSGLRPGPSSVICNTIEGDVSTVEYVVERARAIDTDTGGRLRSVEVDKDDPMSQVWAVAAPRILEALQTVGSPLTPGGGEASVTDATGAASPYTSLTSLGHSLQATATTVNLVALTASSVAYGASESAAGWFGAGVARGAWDWAHFLALGLVTLLGGSGMVLAHLIPFLPVLLWVLMIVTYLRTVLEAFAAAPLAVAQMLTPEGEGISGTRMERAWALMAAVVARPPLMVVGLVGSIALSYVGFAALNGMLWFVAGQSETLSPWRLVALLVLYPAAALTVVTLAVKAMRTIPDAILDWFSGGVGGAFGETGGEAERGIGGAGGTMQSTGAAMQGGVAQKTQSNLAERRRERARHNSEEEQE